MIEQTSQGRHDGHSNELECHERAGWADNTVRFTDRMVLSDAFYPLYQEGMRLVEDAATYLDGRGKQDSSHLSTIASALYSDEAMRLTSRLMNIASWLLLQRALRNGDMSRSQVKAEQEKISLAVGSAGVQARGWIELAPEFTALIVHSLRLQERLIYLNGAATAQPMSATSTLNSNTVSDQMLLLHSAFGRN